MRTSSRRKLDIGLMGLGATVLAAASLIGGCVAGNLEEIDRYWTSAAVAADGSARVTEVIDYDVGLTPDKHGIFRWVPGLAPDADITVSSPDAPSQFTARPTSVENQRGETVGATEIKIGDPARTISGRNRYEIGYTLPGVRQDATVDWEAVGTGWDVDVSDVEVHLVTPFVLDSPSCFAGPAGSTSACDVREVEPGHLVVSIDELGANEGVSIEGTQGAALAATPAVPAPPSGPPADDERTNPLVPAGTAAGAFLLAAVPVTALVRRAGRERVYEGGAADAAFGGPPLGGTTPWPGAPPHAAPAGQQGAAAPPGVPPPPPVPGTVAPVTAVAAPPPPPPEPETWGEAQVPAGVRERRVSMTELEQMTTIEFAPPSELSPAHGGIVLREQVHAEHKVAWLIQAAIDGVITLDDDDGDLRISHRDAERATPEQATIFGRMFRRDATIELGTYDKDFAAAWSALDSSLSGWRRTSGLWDVRADRRRVVAIAFGLIGAIVGGVAAVGGGVLAGLGTAAAVWFLVGALGGGVAGAGLAAAVGAHELHVRTAAGSSLWLRVESFRRFLAESEGYHAEEAARRGVLREYTAWAVAVGEVDRWSRAVSAAAIAPEVSGVHYAYMAPLLMTSTRSAATAPSSSGGGGGFGGGSVGGGAGGGGGGSW
jgi:hypothetical protein